MILICENCEHGYRESLRHCPWCNTSATLAYQAKPAVRMCDTECYVDYWLCKIDDQDFQSFPGHPLDVEGLRRALSISQIVTFNGQHYDLPMITLALTGTTPATLKQASDEIIKGNLRSWEFYQRWNLDVPDWIDHIDVFDVAPGTGSLKMYGGKMHSRKLQDLPFKPEASIGLFDRCALREYCANDLDLTRNLYETFTEQLALRESMSAEYGVDLRSKSDAQISEAVMRKLLPFKPEPPYLAPGTTFKYRPPAWLRFVNLKLLELLDRSPFTITPTRTISMTEELEKTHIKIGGSAYHMGIGGLHSSESGAVHVADEHYSLQDVDVTGYYPSLILVTEIFPEQIGPVFQQIYRSWVERRVAAKRSGDKKTANSLKTLTNGTFGKLGSPYSIFYAPSEMIQVTVTGQLALLMLIESLELCGISVVSANTDGILIKCPRALEWLRDSIVKSWCASTGLETESADYRMVASRDVNNYIAIGINDAVKSKGAYAPPDPGASGWPNPTGQICTDAIIKYLKTGIPFESTIRACKDIRKFVYLRQVKGGGEWMPGAAMSRSATQAEMAAVLTSSGWKQAISKTWSLNGNMVTDIKTAYAACFAGRDPVYLGKAVRWYYATGANGHIRYIDSGNRVAKTDGCKPLMELPDVLPEDVDYAWYVRECNCMLADLGLIITA